MAVPQLMKYHQQSCLYYLKFIFLIYQLSYDINDVREGKKVYLLPSILKGIECSQSYPYILFVG